MAKPKNEQYELDPEDGLIRGIVGPWSVDDKHERLRRYVHASHGARRRFTREYGREASFIDLYCGPGRAAVKGTNRVVDGSPLIAMKAAAASTDYTRYIIGDIDQTIAEACSERLKRNGALRVDRLIGPSRETAKIASKILDKKGLHFTLIDPFNADLPFETIAELAQLERMDQLIHFSVMDYRRNLKPMMEDGRLDSFAPGWSTAVRNGAGINETRVAIFNYWKTLLEKRLRYKVSDTVVNVKAKNKADIYWLVFVSRHDLGGKLWKEVANINPQQSLIW
jgi:three-Cys-motif partner protein